MSSRKFQAQLLLLKSSKISPGSFVESGLSFDKCS